MKRTLLLLAIFALLTFALPYAALFLPSTSAPSTSQNSASQSGAQTLPEQTQSTSTTKQQHGEDPLLILDVSSDTVLSVPIREFVLGAVAAEMPMSYPDEALKAQAVAAHSYALAVKAGADPNDFTLKGAYFKANPSQRFGFVTTDVMQNMWGDAYTENLARLEALVDSVLTEILLYEGEPALACYHAISNGQTEAAENVWGSPVPYLVAVDSALDMTAESYEVETQFSAQEFLEGVKFNFTGIELTGTPDTWVTRTEQSASGYTTRVHFGLASVSGGDFRTALGLRSADFTIVSNSDNTFTITTRGYGHGVGMSQYGASAMALMGKTYQEILSHYYPGTMLGSSI